MWTHINHFKCTYITCNENDITALICTKYNIYMYVFICLCAWKDWKAEQKLIELYAPRVLEAQMFLIFPRHNMMSAKILLYIYVVEAWLDNMLCVFVYSVFKHIYLPPKITLTSSTTYNSKTQTLRAMPPKVFLF